MNFETAAAWSHSFSNFFAQFAHCFQRSETRNSVQLYLRGLLANVQRKNNWQLAETMGLSDPHCLQRVLNESKWEDEFVGQTLCQVVNRDMGYEPGIGVIDESGFVKWGKQSAGVARQYCGRIGKVENCQVGVFLGYVAAQAEAFLDAQLYLPKAWCDDPERCQAAKIPDDIHFQTKPQIAGNMLERAWDEGLPMQWVTADSLYGNSPGLRELIHERGRFYVMALGRQHRVQLFGEGKLMRLDELISELGSADWEAMCFSIGEKGLIWYEWLALRVELPNDTFGEQWLLIQRTLDEQAEYRFYISNAPEDSDLAELAGVALARHRIESLFEEAKGQVGMGDYEVRSWHGWHRHMVLVMLAHTWLKLLQHKEREKKAFASMVELQCGRTKALVEYRLATANIITILSSTKFLVATKTTPTSDCYPLSD